jgi:hypothetical protein
MSSPGGGTLVGLNCPSDADTKPTAIVNTDAPWLGKLGWFLIGVGFFLQIFSIEEPLLSSDEIRRLRKLKKLL